MATEFITKPLEATPGWVAKAHDQGLRVTFRRGRFGRTDYVIRDSVGVVQLKQADGYIQRGVIDEPTLGQYLLLKQLSKIGLIEFENRRSALSD